MRSYCRSREKQDGWLGRRRNYICRECHQSFQVDTLGALPEIDRVCPDCKGNTYVYLFVNKRTGKEKQIRAFDIELASLKARQINPDLTFKVPQPTGG